MKRLFDFFVSGVALLVASPIFILIAIAVKLDSKGPVFYKQVRVGKDSKDFKIFKFRTMVTDADKQGLITVGNRDSRITRVGYFLRKSKLDELSQLINVFEGTMSFVGPRPEVRKYVDMYNEEQLQVLSVQPGITDIASIEYSDENAILAQYEDPDKAYIEIVMPAKLELNLEYIRRQSFLFDIYLIFRTIFKIIA